MSILGLFDPPKKKNRTYQGTQFEIFVEQLFRHSYRGIQRNTIFEIVNGKRKLFSTQIDICCKLSHFYNWKDKYGLFELKYSNEFTINEDAVTQLLRSCYNLQTRQSRILVEPVAVVTNKDFTRRARILAEKHGVGLINGEQLNEMYKKAHFVTSMLNPDVSIDDKIRAINVKNYRTAPHYVHIHV